MNQEVIFLAHLWSLSQTGLRLSFSLWPVALMTWLFQVILLLPLLIPLFSYLATALPPPAALSSPATLSAPVGDSAAAIPTALSLVAGSAPHDWDAMQISLYHDLMLPFSTTVAGSIWRTLQWMPLVLYLLLSPFWQAGIWSALRHRLVFPRHRSGLIKTFFEGISRRGLASFSLSLWLAPAWLFLWWLCQKTAGWIDAVPWSPLPAILIALLFVIVLMALVDLLTLFGDTSRWRLVAATSDRKGSALTVLLSTLSGLSRHMAFLLLIRFSLQAAFLMGFCLVLWAIQHGPSRGITGVSGAFLLQQTAVFLLIFARLASIGATGGYLHERNL
ncbi:hypothetical protein GTO89_00635 [Heliobacterium gestii]|uniref:Uncharacterized protein n=1 Tax=Heliomicrobium gestii TaxID=2699 RepID=A0A845LFC4_HELGE|nr:hypothetical protein [Heliomicrobium gestii]MBM7865273.1 putative membrane protein YhdT [Heliomicrobium gestii]MZP41536.1 hypothetical protein [Heliomicrobium gestii]